MASPAIESVPNSMADALKCPDPTLALLALAEASKAEALAASQTLQEELHEGKFRKSSSKMEMKQSSKALASADSIHSSLVQIASGGSEASQAIQRLENTKEQLDAEAASVQWALSLRKAAQQTHQYNQSYAKATQALQPYWKFQEAKRKNEKEAERVALYAGDYILRQLDNTVRELQKELMDKYRKAVQEGDLQAMGQWTPLLGQLELESQAVQLYLEFLQGLWAKAVQGIDSSKGTTMQVAKTYNTAVNFLRHHLPMVSQSLHKASGDIALVQWMHSQVQDAVLGPLEAYVEGKSLARLGRLGREWTLEGLDQDWATVLPQAVGSLPDVDSACVEIATLLQHSESYFRFGNHASQQVTEARTLRGDETPTAVFPLGSPLHMTIAELGGYYAPIEECLLLASIQRALEAHDPMNSRHYQCRILEDSQQKILQTTVMDTCSYAARRSLTRALATGHAETAQLVVPLVSNSLIRLATVLQGPRAHDQAQLLVKPSSLGGLLSAATTSTTTAEQRQQQEEYMEQLGHACAHLNDLYVGQECAEHLERVLEDAIRKGYSQNSSNSDASWKACRESLKSATQAFSKASEEVITHLEQQVLRSRIRGILSQSIGAGNDTMTNILAKSTATDGGVHMNYNVTEEGYNLAQIGQGYMNRLLWMMDELLDPLRDHLDPHLWDALIRQVWDTVAARMEAALLESDGGVTNLGAFLLDADVRDMVAHIKTKLQQDSTRIGNGPGRLLQIAKLLCVDDLDDVLDLLASQRPWTLSKSNVVDLLCLRTDFENDRVQSLLQQE